MAVLRIVFHAIVSSRLLLICGLALTVQGCLQNRTIRFHLESTEEVNMDRDGLSTPVTVKIIPLSEICDHAGVADILIEKHAPLDALNEMHAKSSMDLEIWPASRTEKRIEVGLEANCFLAIALFKNPDFRNFRQVVPIDRGQIVNKVKLKVDRNRLDINQIDKIRRTSKRRRSDL